MVIYFFNALISIMQKFVFFKGPRFVESVPAGKAHLVESGDKYLRKMWKKSALKLNSKCLYKLFTEQELNT